MKNKYEKTLREIVKDMRNIINLPSEAASDGECLDMIEKYLDSLEKEG